MWCSGAIALTDLFRAERVCKPSIRPKERRSRPSIDAKYCIVLNLDHVALTIDARNQFAAVYLNGALSKQCPVDRIGLAQGAVAMRLGATVNKQAIDTGRYLRPLDALRFYKRVLTPDEIEELYADKI
jgi:hypothetical protein